MKASYNITNDKLKVWFDSRLPEEDYKLARRAGFTFWHGSQCFAAKWSPTAEDFVKSYGIEIEAEHWRRRVAGAISAAAYKERPDVIARRIRGLEADLARNINKSTVYEPQPNLGQSPEEIWIGKSRGGYWARRSQLPGIQAYHNRWIAHLKKRIAYEMACLEAAGGAPDVLRPKRKVAVQPKGKAKARDGKALELGGAAGIRSMMSNRVNWQIILGVNRTTVDVLGVGQATNGNGETRTTYHKFRKAAYKVETAKTAAEVRAEMPEQAAHFDRAQITIQLMGSELPFPPVSTVVLEDLTAR